MEKELLQGNPQEQEPISGWLAFFLWVGVGLGLGLGAIASCISPLPKQESGWKHFSHSWMTN